MAWDRNNRIAALVSERGLSTTGFRRGLRALVDEFAQADEEVTADDIFDEWFGEINIVPAAWRVRRDRIGIWGCTVEIYEVEASAEISTSKLAVYGRCADGCGPNFELHILDKYDHEIIVFCEELMSFMCIESDTRKDQKDLLKYMRSRAAVQHHVPIILTDHRTDEQISGLLQDVIYRLGAGQSLRAIAEYTGVEASSIKAVADILNAKSINPRSVLKDTHAKWKVAYDAVRELGIQL